MNIPNNEEELVKVGHEQGQKVCNDVESFRSFLSFSSANYKRSFANQLLIMSQKPTATAVANFDFWNNTLHRKIRVGEKALRTLDENNGDMLACMFDVSQTVGDAEAVKQLVWRFEPNDSKIIKNIYSLDNSGQLDSNDVMRILSKFPTDKFADNIDDFPSFSNERKQNFFNLCFLSSCYIISERLKLNTSLIDEQNQSIWNEFNSYLASDKISAARISSNISREILLQMERVIINERRTQQFIERKNREWHTLQTKHTTGRDSILRPTADRIEGYDMSVGQLWESGKEISVGGEERLRRKDDIERRVLDVREGDRRASGDNHAFDNGKIQADHLQRQNIGSGQQLRGFVEDKSGNQARERGVSQTRDVGQADINKERILSNAGGENSSSVFLSDTPTLEDLLKLNEEQATNAKIESSAIVEDISSDDLSSSDYIFSDEYAALGQKANFKNNIAAIKLLNEIENEGRKPTEQEQAILASYVGWGGISSAFDDKNVAWANEYAELKALLTEDEYRAAVASTTTAFYTPSYIVREIYSTLKRFGFNGGTVLDPSAGTGRFFYSRPQDFKSSCKFFATELDSISGRIAKLLTPSGDIKICGFEQADYPDNFFDVAITNVPFGSIKISDKRYEKNNFLIHDYFFAKAIDKVRQGGIIAFITSKGTLDKANEEARKYIFERTDFIGAVRLPGIAFRAAGTEATSDIIFLQKRHTPNLEQSPYLGLDKTENGVAINAYFDEHPNMMLGKMEYTGMYGGGQISTLKADFPENEIAQRLHYAMAELTAVYTQREITQGKEIADGSVIFAVSQVSNYSYGCIDGKIYYRENSIMTRQELSKSAEQRLVGILSIRDCLTDILGSQVCSDVTDEELSAKRTELNRLYDNFVSKHGSLNFKENAKLFSDDAFSSMLFAIEEMQKDGIYAKADIFFKRTAGAPQIVDKATSAIDALAICMNDKNKVDFEFMRRLYNKSEDEIRNELVGKIFAEPKSREWQTADEYLSGDVRSKLATAKIYAEQDSKFNENVEALTAALPEWIDAGNIYASLGCSWISREYYQQFMYELLNTAFWKRENNGYGNNSKIKLIYNNYTSEWTIKGKSLDTSVNATQVYGTSRINAYQIIEDSLNMKDVVIKDAVPYVSPSGKDSIKYVVNPNETAVARAKQEQIRLAFADWIFNDVERRKDLVETYNRLFNCIRERHYDGSGLTLPHIKQSIVMKPHQLDAIARIRSGNNTLLDHVVGAGKTYTMIAGAKEQLRLGFANKVLFVVPNHLTGQFGSDIYKLYPNTRALIASKKGFEKENRKRFFSRIALSDAEMIVIGHSQFEMLAMSAEYQAEQIEQEINQITEAIKQLKQENGERYSVKQFETMKKNLETQMKKLYENSKKDTMLTFEQLGINSLFVDEAHYYKNCAIFSKMRNVAGINNTRAAKASDMLMKVRYLSESGGIVTFATGTPISNSMAEMYVMQRYLQNDLLIGKGITHFDEWAANFGEVTTAMELAPEGGGYRLRTRFAKFHNLPELLQMYRQVADVQTAEMLKLPIPDLCGGKAEIIACEPSDELEEFMEESIERVQRIRNREVSPMEDNMLKFTGDAKKAGLDMRLIDPSSSFDENGKLAKCAEKIYEQYLCSTENQGAQLVFCDTSTPNVDKFDVYNETKRLLIIKGIPEDEIAFIHSAKNETEKESMFAKVRNGQIRVLIGSTQKMGAGTNVQERLVALHHLDCPYRPSDIEQREGRILRQGNTNREVHIYRYVTKRSFDAYLWNIVETKQKFISQIRCGSSAMRSCEDLDEAVLSYAEAQAIASGDPRIKEKIEIDAEVARLQLLKSRHKNEQYRFEDELKKYPERIDTAKKYCDDAKKDFELAQTHATAEFNMKVGNRWYEERTKAAERLIDFSQDIPQEISKQIAVGELNGFEVSLKKGVFENKLVLSANCRYETEFSVAGGHYNIVRLENLIKDLPNQVAKAEKTLQELEQAQATAAANIGKPFENEAELAEKLRRQADLNAELEIKSDASVIADEGQAAENEEHSPRHSNENENDGVEME